MKHRIYRSDIPGASTWQVVSKHRYVVVDDPQTQLGRRNRVVDYTFQGDEIEKYGPDDYSDLTLDYIFSGRYVIYDVAGDPIKPS